MGRKTKANSLGKEIKRNPGANSSISARNLTTKQLGGVIFGCTTHTIKECLSKLIFGLPSMHFSYIRNVEPGLPLFLFNYSDRRLHGIYEAAGHGRLNINPHGWTTNGSDTTEFPAQVRVHIRKQCDILKEEQYKKILQKNYYSDNKNLFWFELDRTQTAQLLALFESSPLSGSSARFYKSVMQKPPNGVVFKSDMTKEGRNWKKSDTIESRLPADLPATGTNRKWVSLFKELSDPKAKGEGDDKPLTSEDNWKEDGLKKDSGSAFISASWGEETLPPNYTRCWEEEPRSSGIADSWEEEAGPSGVNHSSVEGAGPSGNADSWKEEAGLLGFAHSWEKEPGPSGWEEETGPSGWEEENQIAEIQPEKEANEGEEERIYVKLRQLTFNTEHSNTEKDTVDAFFPCVTGNLHLEDEPASLSATAKVSSNTGKEIKDAFVPFGVDNSHSEDAHSLVTSSTSEMLEDVSTNSSDSQFVVDQLRKELKEIKAFSTDQHRKTSALEKKLVDSDILLQHLRRRVVLLESDFHDPSTRGVEVYTDPCGSAKLIETIDESCLGVDELIFLMGGHDGLSWLPTMDFYSPSRDMLSSVKTMSSSRSYALAAVVDGLIYNIGGWTCSGEMWHDTVECYNPLSKKWISCPPLSEKKGCVAGVSLNDKIYAVGGGNGKDCFEEVEMFDPMLERWTWTLMKSMLQKRFASAAAVLDGVLYVVGGYDGKKYLKTGERFDPREDSWSKIDESMNTSRGGHALTAFKGKLYALGGYDGKKHVSSVEVFDPRMGSWVPGDEMNQSRGYFAAPVLGDAIYAIGGQTDGNAVVETVETYRVDGDGWSVSKVKGIGKRCSFSAAIF